MIINPFVFGGGGAGGPLDDWSYYVEVTIQSSQVGNALTEFPVYVDLSTLPAGFFTNVNADGSDIRVTEADGATQAPIDLVSINTGGSTGELHFLASSLSASTNTTYRIYYGNAAATAPAAGSTYGRNAVWADYEAVWHFANDPSGTAPQLVDSTGNSHDGTSSGTMTSGDLTTGKLGAASAINFDGSDDHISIGMFTSPFPSNYHTTAWFRTSDTSTQPAIFGSIGDAGKTYHYLRLNTDGAGGNINGAAHLYNQDAVGDRRLIGTADNESLTNGAWHKLTIGYQPSAHFVAVDGVSLTPELAAFLTFDPASVSIQYPIFIGASNLRGAANNRLNGDIDELRWRGTTVSAAWEASEFTNQATPGTFYSVGSQTAA